jgi:rhamnose utilization protein RhaD (predicted bifunctional aldolase and dehydrogenase)
LTAEHLSDVEIRDGLQGAVEDGNPRQPSVETFLHALFLTEGGARWVAHTHPIAVNQILCSQLGAEPFLGHIYPEAVIVCGTAPAVIPYVDPGLPLAQAARTALRAFQDKHGHPPKTVLMVNHGLVALGQTSREALNITRMADKWARVLVGTYAFGGPRFLPDEQVARIEGRPDEVYRRRQLEGSA